MPVLACQAMPIPYLEGGLVGAMEHQCRPGSAGAMEHQCRPGLAWASEEASVVVVVLVVVLDAAGRDGVAIMVTLGGKFTILLRR